jgi:hypothetical protein
MVKAIVPRTPRSTKGSDDPLEKFFYWAGESLRSSPSSGAA